MDGMNQQWNNNQPQQNQQYNNQPQNQYNQRLNWNNPVPNVMSLFRDPNTLASLINLMNQNQNQSYNPVFSGFNNPQPTPQPAQNPVRQTVNEISSARVITSTEDIRPSEIPVDDTTRLFMMDDMQTIYAKKWDNTGELQNMVFKRIPDKEQTQNEPNSNQMLNEISDQMKTRDDKLASLEARIDALLDATTELANKVTKMEVNGSKSTQKKGGASTNE